MINFTKIITTFYCVGHDRVADAYGSMMNLLINTSNGNVVFCLNTLEQNEQTNERVRLLEATAKATDNSFTLLTFDQSISKAHMQDKCVDFVLSNFDTNDHTYFMSVDDDFFIPYKTLDLIAQAVNEAKSELYIYGLFDVINYRNFEDWSDTKLELKDLFNFIKENGMRCLINHLYTNVPDKLVTFKVPGQSCGSYLFQLDAYVFNVGLRNGMKAYPKFKRGYDNLLCNSFNSTEWIFGSNSYHTDRTKAHVDGVVWKQDIFRDDQMLDNKVVGRPPVTEIGAMSLKRTTQE